ncbi:MAG: efflux transporter periplasmic adaptor subunit [Halomonas sp.]|uniref:HlyD family secretion protein n=1 Tax=Oceanospirillales TaxID=135619 RepID=UPI000C4C7129|nr:MULTISPECIES: HlyD family secretion protein [Oceanospirillales]MAP34402.1 efflux transporter periplasmic adaptor subunit [Halomonas sp.]MBI46610.1 efflux transporter periplasmic adaptor subunit [Marinobacter sp.]MBS97612.1 efflux transporter periplasmic adaptor subunit [Oceanospirillaceae bacterium]MCE7524018.1 HlyD family secretion protein [Alloalcanivorax xenomutans]|tara:strand:- start:982 stop:2016 length:1035 start_codon:yes stop_codon:yes gene_type:complete
MALPRSIKLTAVTALLAVAAGSVFYLNRHESGASNQSTDDAYVQADFTYVAPQIAGKINQVLVEENQQVKVGDLLATIDNRDFVVAVEAARAQVASANASVASLAARLEQQDNLIHQAQAAVTMDEAELELAKANHQRYRNLAADGSGTVEAMQQAETQLNIRLASQERNLAGLQAARQQVAILQADLDKAKAAQAQAQAAHAAAELKLSYTQITAPVDGTVGRKSVRVGAFVTTGSPLLAIVPLDAVYITANYRETQLARIQTGQTVEIKVDALPGVSLKGVVESLGPASGVSYSAITPHNATGNFTKIVQRLPVRIRVDSGQPEADKLRVGMSVVPTIQTRN